MALHLRFGIQCMDLDITHIGIVLEIFSKGNGGSAYTQNLGHEKYIKLESKNLIIHIFSARC